MNTNLDSYEQAVAGAIISVDTLWGGDVNCRSGTGRVIADSYFSGKDLPECYGGPEAGALRKVGGVSAQTPPVAGVTAYVNRWRPLDLIAEVKKHAAGFEPTRRVVVDGLADALKMQYDLALELVGQGPAVAYDDCVIAGMGARATQAHTGAQLQEVRKLLGLLGYPAPSEPDALVLAVDDFRAKTWVGKEGIDAASARIIAELQKLTAKNFSVHLPEHMRGVPLSNVKMIPIKGAWFSGSMNYLGRGRTADGTPEYEAEYEINADIEKSIAEFHHLVAHEVIPGHVSTFALIQYGYHTGRLGFESTILTMNTRHSVVFEGIANAALMLAHGVRTPGEISSPELRLGMLLSELEDMAKNNASYFTWADHVPAGEIKKRLRLDCLVTQERANKLTDAWAQHPLMGRAYMPSYRYGTELVLDLIAKFGPGPVIRAVYGVYGLCDSVTLPKIVAAHA